MDGDVTVVNNGIKHLILLNRDVLTEPIIDPLRWMFQVR